ncbi:unnamed protein product, partial [Brassica rapa]
SQGSWIWRKLLKLRSVAYQLIRHEVRDVGKLLELTGEQGTRYLGILRYATVSDGIDNSGWRIGGGRNRIFQELISQIQEHPLPASDLGPDIVL